MGCQEVLCSRTPRSLLACAAFTCRLSKAELCGRHDVAENMNDIGSNRGPLSSAFLVCTNLVSGRAKRETAKGRNRTQNAHFRRFLQIFADFRLALRDLGVADLRRKPQIFAGNRRKPQIFAEWWTFRIFYIFSARARGRGSEAPERGWEGPVFY